MSLIANLRNEVLTTDGVADYSAVELLWNVLIKASHKYQEEDEFKRLSLLVMTLNVVKSKAILDLPATDALLNLQPPLETIITDPHERLAPQKVMQEIQGIRTMRQSQPSRAIIELMYILKRIRNKRIHGFKTSDGPRDSEILAAARSILRALCEDLI